MEEQLEIKPQIADENAAPQYHNPKDLSTIEQQLGIIQSAEDTFKQLQGELDEKKTEIEEKDSLIKQANELIQQLREKVDEKEKTNVEKLKNFGVQIDKIVADAKSVKVNKPETKKEVENNTSDVKGKEVKEPKPAIQKENKPEDKTEKTDEMNGWSQFGVQEESKPKGKTSRTKTKEEIELAKMLNAK